MIIKAMPILLVLMLLAVVCIIVAERFWRKAEYGALAIVLIIFVAYSLFPFEVLMEASKQIAGWFSLAVFVFLACLFFLSPRFFEKWKGRHGCSSGT